MHTHYYCFKFWGHAWNSGDGHRWFDWKMNSKKLPPPPALDFMFWAPVLSIRRTTCLISVLHKRNLSIKTIKINWLILFLSPPPLLPASCFSPSSDPHLSFLLSSCATCSHNPFSLPLSVSSFPILEACFSFFFLNFPKHLSKEALCLKQDYLISLCWKPSKYRVKERLASRSIRSEM